MGARGLRGTGVGTIPTLSAPFGADRSPFEAVRTPLRPLADAIRVRKPFGLSPPALRAFAARDAVVAHLSRDGSFPVTARSLVA